MVSRTDGAPLFDEAGRPTQVLHNVKAFLGEMRTLDALTQQFCRFLAEHQLLTPLNLRARDKDRFKSVAGCFAVNEERVQQLPDALHLEMKRQGYLAPVYAQLVSLAQIERLVRLQDERASGALW